MTHFTVETPFPSDCAPYKVIRHNGAGASRIETASQTRTGAEALKRRLEMEQFQDIWNEAKRAGQQAAQLENMRLGDEQRRGLDCGFAWVTMSGNIPFARWAKKEGLASKNHPSGLMIWYSKIHSCPTQSVSVHEAACRAARDVLAQRLGTSMIGMSSRLD